MKDLLNLIGLATRAGKVTFGESPSLDAIKKNKAQLIFVADDAGTHTNKRIHDKAKYYGVPVINSFTKDELSIATGSCNRVVCAITDKGFSKKMLELSEKGK